MKKLSLLSLILALLASTAAAAPISTYPPATLPYGPSDAVIGSQGLLTRQFLLSAIGAVPLVADEAITAPALVSVTSTFHIVRASAATGLPAAGFVMADVSNGGIAIVYSSGVVTGLSGLTGGAAFLSYSSAGGVTSTPPPAGSGNYVQKVGTAVSATSIIFVPSTMNGPL